MIFSKAGRYRRLNHIRPNAIQPQRSQNALPDCLSSSFTGRNALGLLKAISELLFIIGNII